mgnify:CR=1 FL=1
MSEYHVPVLLKESVDGLDIRQGGVYLDLTFGGGGHSGEILKRLDAEGCLLGFDQDEDALANVPEDDRFIFVNHNFRYLRNFMRYYVIMFLLLYLKQSILLKILLYFLCNILTFYFSSLFFIPFTFLTFYITLFSCFFSLFFYFFIITKCMVIFTPSHFYFSSLSSISSCKACLLPSFIPYSNVFLFFLPPTIISGNSSSILSFTF